MKSIKLLLPVVAVAFSGLASASIRSHDVPSVVVKYGDLNLGTASGVKSLHARLNVAAKTVCVELESRVLGLREQRDQCVRDAVRRSVADVGNPNLTKYLRYRALPTVVAAN